MTADKHHHPDVLVALAGQPNTGKSTVFNLLTGARQHVANFPGVTVEKKQGSYPEGEHRVEVVDLPGTYSLNCYSQEERVARDFILLERPEVVVNVVDASHLERNLYLTLQLREMGVPMVVCLNMVDVVQRRGGQVDAAALSEALGVPVVATVASRGAGRDELRAAINGVYESGRHRIEPRVVVVPERLEAIVAASAQEIAGAPELAAHYPPRWLAVKLIEGDREARRLVLHHPGPGQGLLDDIEARLAALNEDEVHAWAEQHLATARHQDAAAIAARCHHRGAGGRRTRSDRADRLLLHPLWGSLLLAAVFFLFYKTTITLGEWMIGHWVGVLEYVRAGIDSVFPRADLIRDGLLGSLVVNGVVDGANAVLEYVPMLAVLYLLIGVLEDSGYMARVAFLMDRLLRCFGLHGQSTLPMVLGGVVAGGCAVPGVLATRAMQDQRARLTTILVIPLLNCSAKIPFYVLIVGIFFPGREPVVLLGISLFSVFMALIAAKVLSQFVVRGDEAPFLLELPNYHLPTARGVFSRGFDRLWHFVRKVMTIVILVAMVAWFFLTFPGLGDQREAQYDARVNTLIEAYQDAAGDAVDRDALTRRLNAHRRHGSHADDPALLALHEELEALRDERAVERPNRSFAGRLGRALEPVSRFAGFDWRINVSIISSFAAKENMAATLGTIYSVETGDGEFAAAVRQDREHWSYAHALAILILVALFPPCLPTLMAIKLETGSWKWTALAAVYPVVVGFILAVLAFQVGQLLGLGG